MNNEYAEDKARKEPRDAGEPGGDFVDLQARGWEKEAAFAQHVPPVPEDRKGCVYSCLLTQ